MVGIMVNKIGEKIKIARKELGLSQKELSNKLGIDQTAMSKYENNLRRPSIDIFKKLEKLTGKSVQYFIDDNLDIEGIETGHKDKVLLNMFGQYSIRNNRILWLEDKEEIPRDLLPDENMTEMEIRENYFLYELKDDIGFFLEQGTLLIFKKLENPITNINQINSEKTLLLLDKGIVAVKRGDNLVPIHNKDETIETFRIIATVVNSYNRKK
jgi:transcriptional regulator with XRE-family HTH domain